MGADSIEDARAGFTLTSSVLMRIKDRWCHLVSSLIRRLRSLPWSLRTMG